MSKHIFQNYDHIYSTVKGIKVNTRKTVEEKRGQKAQLVQGTHATALLFLKKRIA